MSRRAVVSVAAWLSATVGPAGLTAILLRTGSRQRDYVFLYLGLVAVVAVLTRLGPALVAALSSFLFLDYFFVQPVGTLVIARGEDLVNLVVFLVTALLVGVLAAHRRRAREHVRQLANELERSNINREVLANVSHDLRTPLGVILTESTALQASGRVRGEAQESLHAIEAEARRLSGMVGQILDLARIEGSALELQLEPLRLSDAIEAAVARLRRRSPERIVDWDRQPSAVDVRADWQRLGQVLDNLLENADRHGPPGTPIRLEVTAQPDGMVAVRVVDQGPGVPASIRDRLFERFAKAEPSVGTAGGIGLGLAIVRGLVEAQGGTVGLEEREGEGASFRFTLPSVRP
jgi:two-component system sensor histidine kinase KdpD